MVYTTKEETGHEENCSCNLGRDQDRTKLHDL